MAKTQSNNFAPPSVELLKLTVSAHSFSIISFFIGNLLLDESWSWADHKEGITNEAKHIYKQK